MTRHPCQRQRASCGRSVFLWPRHPRNSLRKSSIDSSSGQKSPRSSRGSRGKITPCSATSSSIVGCPWRLYFSATDIDDPSLPHLTSKPQRARGEGVLDSVRESLVVLSFVRVAIQDTYR